MSQDDRLFTVEDIEILSYAVSIHPNLEYACFATKLAKKHLNFPVKTYEEFERLFSIKDLPQKVAKRKLGSTHLRKFFPKEFFPIQDSWDFLGKTFAALSWGDTIHYHERFLKNPERFSSAYHRKVK